MTWRTGRRVGRTIYMQTGLEPSDSDVLIGLMDTTELARKAVAAVRGGAAADRERLERAYDLTDHAASAWRDSPVTSLVIRWLHPELGRVLDRMLNEAIDDQVAVEAAFAGREKRLTQRPGEGEPR